MQRFGHEERRRHGAVQLLGEGVAWKPTPWRSEYRREAAGA
jgi:hypothetical protein